MIAYYMRLSRAQDREGESQSIENQRKMLMDYQRRQVDLGGSKTVRIAPPHLEYIDDGFTGTNFKRPAWRQLIEDCKKGKVKTILAKDASRIGRNYVEVEEYFSQIFPMLGVRVICVMENYDSKDAIESEIISLENIMNSYYVKDLKRKIESSFRTIQKSGKIYGKNTPFGYVCEDRNEGWKVDPEAAEIVRLIFAEAASGKSTGEIAKVLNQKGCKTPDKRKYKNAAEGSKNDPVIVETNVWDSHKVKRTLKNEQYTGVRIAHLTKINKAGKTVKTAPEEQFRFENDHEALVSPEVFQLAQQALMVQGKKPKRRVSGFLFSGLLRCGKCHRSMSYSKNMSTVYCRRELSLGDSYEGTVLVEDVKAKTWEALKSRAELAKCLLEEQVEKPDVEKAETEIQKLKDALMDRYEAFADGKITKVEFIRYRDENKVLTAKLEQELSLLKGKEEYLVRRKEALVPLAQIAGESELTREMLLKVVDVVYWQDGEVKLKLKADEFLGEKTKGK